MRVNFRCCVNMKLRPQVILDLEVAMKLDLMLPFRGTHKLCLVLEKKQNVEKTIQIAIVLRTIIM